MPRRLKWISRPKEPSRRRKRGKVGEFPHSLHVMDPGVDQEQVDIAVAYDLEGDIEIAVLCVACAYGRPFMTSEARTSSEDQVERRCSEAGDPSVLSGEVPASSASRV